MPPRLAWLDWLCERYQRLFPANYAEQSKLVALDSSQQRAEFLREYFEHELRKGERVIAKFAALRTDWQGGRTLDFGCGAGGLTYQLARCSREAVGIDLEADKIAYAEAQAAPLGITNARFCCYDGGAMPFFEDGSFDTIICVDVMEHLPTPERFLAEFDRLLRPGGQLLISFGPPWYHAHGKHMWTKLPGWWTHLLFPRSVVMRTAGFPPDTTWEALGIQRLSVARFHRAIRQSPFQTLELHEYINRWVWPLKSLPGVRELFIAEVVGIFQKPLA